MQEPQHESTPHQQRARRTVVDHPLFFPLLIVLLTAIAYSSALPAGFIWDDDDYVVNNQLLRSLGGLAGIWFEPGSTPQYYPMVFTLFWAQFQLWGIDPFGYHLVNILLHVANALLLLGCLRQLRVPGGGWVALLFALHPLQVESVAWVTELKNVLALFFSLLSLHAYLRYDDASAGTLRRWWYLTALLLFLLALFSKTVSGSLPAVILLVRWWQRGSIDGRRVVGLLPFFLLAIILGGVTARLEVSHVMASGPEWDFSPLDRLLIAGRAVWFYAGKLLWPHPLMFNYPRWTIDSGVWWQYLFPLSLAGVMLLLWRLRGRIGRGPLTAVLFFAGTLFPALGFFNVYPLRYSYVADHFQYVAGIGLLSLLVGGMEAALRRSGLGGGVRHGVFLGLAVMLSLLTWSQGHAYRDRHTLFTDTIAKNPASWLSYANRGRDYALANRDDLALADLDRALALKPDEPDTLQCRGSVLLKQREFARALADFDKALALQPRRVDYYLIRSKARRIAGQLAPALDDANEVIRLEPDLAEGYVERMAIHANRGEYDLAIQDCYRARDLGYPLAEAELQALLQWIGRR